MIVLKAGLNETQFWNKLTSKIRSTFYHFSINLLFRGIKMALLQSIPELTCSHVHIKDPAAVEEKLLKIVKDGHSKFQVITDFDFTLTKSHVNGVRGHSCYGLITEYTGITPEFRAETHRLYHKYHPIETDPYLTIPEKIPHMIEWYRLAHNLIIDRKFTRTDIERMSEETILVYRDGTDELVDILEQHDLPVCVFSAGLADLLVAALRRQNLLRPNMHIISNYATFDEEGQLVGFQDEIVHMFNKNERAARHASYFQDLAHRPNVLLMGDSLGDVNMAEGIEKPGAILKLGFLNEKVPERLEQYKAGFDIVICEDQTMDIANAIVRRLVALQN